MNSLESSCIIIYCSDDTLCPEETGGSASCIYCLINIINRIYELLVLRALSAVVISKLHLHKLYTQQLFIGQAEKRWQTPGNAVHLARDNGWGLSAVKLSFRVNICTTVCIMCLSSFPWFIKQSSCCSC